MTEKMLRTITIVAAGLVDVSWASQRTLQRSQ